MTMRPVYYDFAPSDADDNGIASALTGAGPWDSGDFITTTIPDGLAHQISLKSGANLSGINITVTGLDADGQEQTEVLAGPSNNTVETTAYFSQVTSISAASTLGANTMDVGWVDEFTSQTIPLEIYLRGLLPTCQVELTGTANFDIEVTNSDIRASSSPPPAQDDYLWLNDANFTNKSASLVANLATLARAIRLVINSYSSGAVLQLGIVTPR